MRAWNGLKTAMGILLRVKFGIAVENPNLIIYTPEADSARENMKKDTVFQAELQKKPDHADPTGKTCMHPVPGRRRRFSGQKNGARGEI